MSYYSIVTFGSPSYGDCRSFYRSLGRAIKDAKSLGGGSLSNVRVVECPSAKAAKEADISGDHPVVWSK